MPTFPTVIEVVNQVAAEVGVNQSPDPYNSPDPQMVKLLALLTVAGQDLVEEVEGGWAHLRGHYDQTVGAGIDTSGSYDLPSGFHHIIDGTPWNRTLRWPVYSLTGVRQQELEANALTSAFMAPLMRLVNNRLEVYPRPVAAGTRISFEYATENWLAVGSASPSKFVPTQATDVVWFPMNLITRLLRLKFLQAVGLDSVAAQVDFERTLSRSLGRDRDAPVLSICGPANGPKLLDEDNVPDLIG